VVANVADKNLAPVLEGAKATVVDYGKYFNPLRRLTMPGLHNQMNAAAAVAAAAQVAVALEQSDAALASFAGTWRRFEYKGEVNGAKVYDDYGHHPTEVLATLRGARELYPDKKVLLVFQSHTYSRTSQLFGDFVQALASADYSFVLPIYAAREDNESGVTHEQLVVAVNQAGGQSEVVADFQTVVARVTVEATADTVVLVMGAGTVTEVATLLTKRT
jgi:UDP-N-acetylmuramate--alanine ligase